MLKLTKITFVQTPRIPGLRAGDVSELDCDNPAPTLKDWRIILKGASVFLVSPAGWRPQMERTRERNPNGPVTIHEIPRANACLHWSGDAADIESVLKGGVRYETEPLGFKPVPVADDKPILAQIPPGQMGDA
jgi:hypothetical protein